MIRLIGNDPIVLGELAMGGWDEFCFVQDMPVKLAGDTKLVLPEDLSFAGLFIGMIVDHLKATTHPRWLKGRNFYLTAKHTYVDAGRVQTRPGWHTDGYGTDDLSFLWSDCVPTEFLKQALRVREDDGSMLRTLTLEADEGNRDHGKAGVVYGMDDTVIHRPGTSYHGEWRRFLKLSVSQYAYDLKGNARNPGLPTPWQPTRERGRERNNPENKG